MIDRQLETHGYERLIDLLTRAELFRIQLLCRAYRIAFNAPLSESSVGNQMDVATMNRLPTNQHLP